MVSSDASCAPAVVATNAPARTIDVYRMAVPCLLRGLRDSFVSQRYLIAALCLTQSRSFYCGRHELGVTSITAFGHSARNLARHGDNVVHGNAGGCHRGARRCGW